MHTMKFCFFCLALVVYSCVPAQNTGALINVKEVERIERTLADDDMQGRRAGTPGSEKAARFIADEFRKAGLQPVQGNSFLQEFATVQPKLLSLKAEADGVEIDLKNIVVVTSQPVLQVSEKSGYKVQSFRSPETSDAGQFFRAARALVLSKENSVVFVDTSLSRNFPRLSFLKRSLFKSNNSVIFILSNGQPKTFAVKAEHQISETKLANVVGVLPGKRRKNEYVIFSAHYDHLGIGRPLNGDSVYNGANDDAAGTTAVIALANYFKESNNERTLVFAAFTAEETGGFGSQYFSQQFNPAEVVAMFNIEMIGTESKWGRNSAYITGFEKTNMGTLLQQNLKGSSFQFYPDPYPEQQLFYRSDNATLARLGVPAHTVSTSKMDNEPNYHKPSDEVQTLDLANMTEIIKAIALSSRSIVSGKDTPSRVAVENLR